MEYKLSKENYTVAKTLYDGTVQQSAELDYILPDYYPEIFKVLCVKILPGITKRTLSQGKLEYELTALVRLTYLSESGEVSAVEQTLSYGKSMEIPSSEKSPRISICPYTESASCRVVNKRRVDIRGIISIAICVTADEVKQAVSEATGGGIQLKKQLITYPSKRIAVTKRITVADDVELGLARPQVKTVLRADCAVISVEKKILSGKLLTKGEAEVSLLYVPEGSGEPESIKFSIPFSQISDIEGLDERFDVILDANAVSCDVRPSSKSENPSVSCELGIEISLLAMRFESAELATDAFSTLCETTLESSNETIECVPIPINESHRQKASLTYYDGEISSVILAGAEVGRIQSAIDKDGSAILRGRINFFAYAKNESGRTIYLETAEQFEHKLPGSAAQTSVKAEARAIVNSASFNLTSSNALEISVDIKITGYLFEDCEKSFISGIIPDETKPVECEKDTAIKLYYAEKGEEPWNIAKRCRASLKAITEENELDCERLSEAKMILIPIVD